MATPSSVKSKRVRKTNYSVKDVLRIIADSDSDLSDSDFEMNETDIENTADSELGLPAAADRRETFEAVGAPFAWEDYPDIDPWEASWIPDFTKQRGVLVDTSDYQPVDYLKLFFPESVFELMANQTNMYAERFFDSPAELSPFSRFSHWQPTTKDELKGYVALPFGA